jgi:hypothetical protein
MKYKIIFGLFLIIVIFSQIISVSGFSDNNIKMVLKKALFEYFDKPKDTTLTLDETKDLLVFYLEEEGYGAEDVNLEKVGDNSNKAIVAIINKALIGFEGKAEEPTGTCEAGYKCQTDFHKAYQNNDCSWSNTVFCEYGCKEGVCVTGNATCIDSDGGKNYYVKGTIKSSEVPGTASSWTDYCGTVGEEEGKLVEYICQGSYGQKVLYDCAVEGQSCYNGACIKSGVNLVWDIDDNGAVSTNDGNLTLRYLFGFGDNALVQSAISSNAKRNNPAEIKFYLGCLNGLKILDVDGNGKSDALTDGLLIQRYIMGFSGQELINGAIGSGATRTTSGEIIAFLSNPDSWYEGACPMPACFTAEDCPTIEGNQYCSGTQLCTATKEPACLNAGTVNAYCGNNETVKCVTCENGCDNKCGNNAREDSEVCDGTDLNGQTCQSLGYDSGRLFCIYNCSGFDVLDCVINPSCNSCSDCDTMFTSCSYQECKHDCGAGCYYRGAIPLIEDCIDLGTACSQILSCKDYSPEECSANSCDLTPGCVLNGGSCVQISSGNSTSVTFQQLKDDITLPHELSPLPIIPTSWGWSYHGWPYQDECGPRTIPEDGSDRYNPWGQIFPDPSTPNYLNAGIELGRMTIYAKLRSDGKWHIFDQGLPIGGYIFTGGDNLPKVPNTAWSPISGPGGGLFYKVGMGNWQTNEGAHWWPGDPHQYINNPDIEHLAVSITARIVLQDPNGPDDRNQARYLIGIGIDRRAADGSTIKGMLMSRHRYLTNEWQTFTMNDICPNMVEIEKPPIHGAIW